MLNIKFVDQSERRLRILTEREPEELRALGVLAEQAQTKQGVKLKALCILFAIKD